MNKDDDLPYFTQQSVIISTVGGGESRMTRKFKKYGLEILIEGSVEDVKKAFDILDKELSKGEESAKHLDTSSNT